MPNGVVNYTVVVQERELLFDVSTNVATELVSGGQLFLNVTITTKPYTEYTAIVTSQTTAGQGQSADGSVITPEESMFTKKKKKRVKKKFMPSKISH